MSKVVIIDYGAGNLSALQSALQRVLGQTVEITRNHKKILSSKVAFLPGVGAFGYCMDNLKTNGLVEVINKFVDTKDCVLIGICAGMQLLADYSEEYGYHEGLGLVPGKVIPFESKLTNVGWSKVLFKPNTNFISTDYYFDHSYHFYPTDLGHIYGKSKFQNKSFVSAINRDNIYGFQFHPEKSSIEGLVLLKSIIHECKLS
jgi:glutamine amidotransferase